MSSDRTIVHEIVVPGTPEQVWNAIATGPRDEPAWHDWMERTFTAAAAAQGS